MKHVRVLSAVLLAVLAMPAVASAAGDDPLLSGYGGPGSGDQAVLSGAMVGDGGSGSGDSGASASLRAAAPSAPAPTSSATGASGSTSGTTSGTTSGGVAGGTGARSGHRATAHHGSGHHRTGAAAPSAPSAAGTAPAATVAAANLPRLTMLPTDADRSSAGALPLSTSDLLLALVVALAIGALAVATRRLSRGWVGIADHAV